MQSSDLHYTEDNHVWLKVPLYSTKSIKIFPLREAQGLWVLQPQSTITVVMPVQIYQNSASTEKHDAVHGVFSFYYCC